MRNASKRPADALPPRLQPLAKLPIFMDLAGRRVVLAGGSAGAAWKAELLAAAGADVAIYAAEPGEEMLGIVARGAAAGTLALHRRPWSLDVFAHAALAVIDCENEAEALAFRCAAKAAGVPVNTVDKPATCDFQFGSIVNRSPIVIGISTDGGAPILGQAIRRRIETLLPASLAGWAALSKTLRDAVAERLAPGPQRRRFWERFSEWAFRGEPGRDADAAAQTLIHEIAEASDIVSKGRVTLVGAGPGDPGLLTLKAVRALQSADVILFDDLVSEGVLELSRREAKRMLVGKRGDRPSCDQRDINGLMLGLAQQGKHVVRLKSGDPMIFGRAGEEIAALQAAGIAVAVVPGITTGLAMAAQLGVSLSERGKAQSVHFVTGRDRHGELPPDLDWAAMARTNTTTLVYMGARTAAKIAARLLAEGLPASTPAIVARDVSRPDQTIWQGTVADLAAEMPSQGNGPAIIGIGIVFAEAGSTRTRDLLTEAQDRLRQDGASEAAPAEDHARSA
jgi:uroporphyrin-III C-methyltransferase / precorrin-2 dehydrogenase / sirohydrochlorin ferrochelatase